MVSDLNAVDLGFQKSTNHLPKNTIHGHPLVSQLAQLNYIGIFLKICQIFWWSCFSSNKVPLWWFSRWPPEIPGTNQEHWMLHIFSLRKSSVWMVSVQAAAVEFFLHSNAVCSSVHWTLQVYAKRLKELSWKKTPNTVFSLSGNTKNGSIITTNLADRQRLTKLHFPESTAEIIWKLKARFISKIGIATDLIACSQSSRKNQYDS